ncbi:HK97-gp10 family putative phage morphogenesis protein, partial [Clostridium tarantellae]
MAYIEVNGLEELIKECERLGGKGATENANRKILKKAAKLTRGEAKGKAPRSENPMNSGRKGSRTGKHMGDNIPLSGVKNRNGSLYIIVGWDKGDNSPFFYAKFIEYGTSKI